MSTPGSAHHIYRFGEFALDVERGALVKSGTDVPLRPKAFEVLRFLVEHHGTLVSKDTLLTEIWSPAVVTDDSVTQCLTEIRRAIDDHEQVSIRTLPRRGYLFDAPVSGPHDAPSDRAAGMAFDPDASTAPTAPTPATHAPNRSRRPLLLMTLAVLLLAFWWHTTGDHQDDARVAAKQAPTTTQAASIAVLPFTDMSPDHDEAYLADGMSEEIIDQLVHIPGLRVIARTSSFAFRGRGADIAEIAARLDVANVLEGSVRKSGDRIRVTVQLIRASDSSHLWSQTYNRDLRDALAMQDDIAAAVAKALKLKLAKRATGAAALVTNPKAYEHFLLGRYFFNRRDGGDLERALKEYELALQDDPDDARAWTGIAGVHRVRFYEKGANRRDELDAMKQAVDRALSLDPALPEAQVRAAHYYYAEGQFDQAWAHYYKAKALNPDAPLLLGLDAAIAVSRGQYDQAVALWRRIVAQDPLAVANIANLADCLAYAGNYEQARAEYEKAAVLDPRGRPEIDTQVALVLILQGEPEQALARIANLPPSAARDEVLAMTGSLPGRAAESQAAIQRLSARPDAANAVRLAEVYAYLQQNGEALKWLQRARELTGNSAAIEEARMQEALASPFLRSLQKSVWDNFSGSLPAPGSPHQ